VAGTNPAPAADVAASAAAAAPQANLNLGNTTPVAPQEADGRTAFEMQIDDQLLIQINARRVKKGAPALKLNPLLTKSAVLHSIDYVAAQLLRAEDTGRNHNDSAGCGRGFHAVHRGVIECVYNNTATPTDPTAPPGIATFIMNVYGAGSDADTSGNMKNLDNPAFTVIGIGSVYRGAVPTTYSSEDLATE